MRGYFCWKVSFRGGGSYSGYASSIIRARIELHEAISLVKKKGIDISAVEISAA